MVQAMDAADEEEAAKKGEETASDVWSFIQQKTPTSAAGEWGPHVRGCSGHRTQPKAIKRSAQSPLRRK